MQKGHTSKILALSAIEGTDFLASVSFDGTVNIWDSSSGSVARTIYNKGSNGDVEPFVSGTFAPDGSWVAGLTKGGQVRRYTLPKGQLVSDFTPPEQCAPWGGARPESPPLATDGGALYYVPGTRVEKGTIYKLDLDGKPIGRLEVKKGVKGPWAAAPGKIAVRSADTLYFYSTDSLQLLNEVNLKTSYFPFAFDPTGAKIAVASISGLQVIDVSSMETLHNLPFADTNPSRTRFRPLWAGEKLYAIGFAAVASDQKIYQANFDTLLTEKTAAGGYAEFGAPLPDGRLAIGGFGFSPQVVDPLSGTTTELAAETGGFSSFTITPSGDLITGGRRGEVTHWSGKTGQQLKSFRGLRETRVTSLDVSPDGKHLVAGDHHGNTICWELESGEPVGKVGDFSSGYDRDVSVLAFQGNDRFFRGMAHDLSLYSLSGEVLRSWELGGSAFAIDSTRQRIASGSTKVGEISLTNKREALLFQSFGARTTALLYDSTDLLVGTSEGELYRWDYSEPESKPELLTRLEKGQAIWSILPGPSNWTLLASGPTHGESVEVSKSGQIGERIRFDGKDLKSLAFTPGGRLLGLGHNYTLQFYEKSSGKKLGSLVGVQQNEGWVALETDGHFDGNSGGLQTVSIELGGEVFKVDQFLQEYLLPGSLARLLGDANQVNMKRTAPALTSSTLKKPPKVSVLEPASGAVVQGGTVEVKIAVSDQGGGVGKLTLSHNGHHLPDSQIRSLGEGKFEATFPPVRGVNEISVTAFEATNSVESRADRIRVTAPNVEERAPRLHLLSIGIDKYQAGLALNLAAVDSESISKQFSSDLYAPGTRLHLTNEAATLGGIQNAVNQIAERADPQDAFVFYLAGHGTVVGETYYFLPYDVKVETDETLVNSSISSEDLAEALRNIPATKQLLILDSCKSGAAVGVVGRYYAARSGLEEIRSQQLLAKSSGTFLIAATKADDYAYEIPELGHGVLTFAILEALGKTGSENENPQLTVNDLLRSVSSRVPALSRKYQGVNQQVLQYSSGQDFLLEADSGKR